MSSNKNYHKEKSNSRLESVQSKSSSYKQYRQKKKKKRQGSRKSKLKSRIMSLKDNKTHKSCNLMTLFTKEYLLNKYNLLRFIVLIVSLILLFVCILYGVGSVISLELEDIWCSKQYTWEEIAQHNRKNNNSLGVGDCYMSGKLRVDDAKLFSTDSTQTAYLPTPVITATAVAKSILYTATSIVLVWILVKYTLACIIDCRKAANNEWYVRVRILPMCEHNLCCNRSLYIIPLI